MNLESEGVTAVPRDADSLEDWLIVSAELFHAVEDKLDDFYAALRIVNKGLEEMRRLLTRLSLNSARCCEDARAGVDVNLRRVEALERLVGRRVMDVEGEGESE